MGGTSGMCCFPLPPGTGEPWGGEDGEMGGRSQFGTKMKGHTWSVGDGANIGDFILVFSHLKM